MWYLTKIGKKRYVKVVSKEVQFDFKKNSTPSIKSQINERR